MLDNWSWILNIDKETHLTDTLIVAGDVTHDLQKLADFFMEVKERFENVFYVPGNHELWIRPSDAAKDSVQKFEQIMTLCRELGVYTTPKKVPISRGS